MHLRTFNLDIDYPVYGAKFVDDSTLLVAGGFGDANPEIGNKITALKVNFKRKHKKLKKFRELVLPFCFNYPTALDTNGETILVGFNEEVFNEDEFSNFPDFSNLRKYSWVDEHLVFEKPVELFTLNERTTSFASLCYISDDGTVGAVASSSQKAPKIVIFDPIELSVKFRVTASDNQLVSDMHISPDGKLLCYITDSTFEAVSTVTGRSLSKTTDFGKNIGSLSKIRFVSNNDMLIAASLKNQKGIAFILYSVSKLKVLLVKQISSKIKSVTSLDYCPVINPITKKFDADNSLIGFSGNDNSITILKYKNFKKVASYENLQTFITKVTFSPTGEYLASVSSNESICLIKIPLEELVTSGNSTFLASVFYSFFCLLFVALVAVIIQYLISKRIFDHLIEQIKKNRTDSSSYFTMNDVTDEPASATAALNSSSATRVNNSPKSIIQEIVYDDIMSSSTVQLNSEAYTISKRDGEYSSTPIPSLVSVTEVSDDMVNIKLSTAIDTSAISDSSSTATGQTSKAFTPVNSHIISAHSSTSTGDSAASASATSSSVDSQIVSPSSSSQPVEAQVSSAVNELVSENCNDKAEQTIEESDASSSIATVPHHSISSPTSERVKSVLEESLDLLSSEGTSAASRDSPAVASSLLYESASAQFKPSQIETKPIDVPVASNSIVLEPDVSSSDEKILPLQVSSAIEALVSQNPTEKAEQHLEKTATNTNAPVAEAHESSFADFISRSALSSVKSARTKTVPLSQTGSIANTISSPVIASPVVEPVSAPIEESIAEPIETPSVNSVAEPSQDPTEASVAESVADHHGHIKAITNAASMIGENIGTESKEAAAVPSSSALSQSLVSELLETVVTSTSATPAKPKSNAASEATGGATETNVPALEVPSSRTEPAILAGQRDEPSTIGAKDPRSEMPLHQDEEVQDYQPLEFQQDAIEYGTMIDPRELAKSSSATPSFEQSSTMTPEQPSSPRSSLSRSLSSLVETSSVTPSVIPSAPSAVLASSAAAPLASLSSNIEVSLLLSSKQTEKDILSETPVAEAEDIQDYQPLEFRQNTIEYGTVNNIKPSVKLSTASLTASSSLDSSSSSLIATSVSASPSISSASPFSPASSASPVSSASSASPASLALASPSILLSSSVSSVATPYSSAVQSFNSSPEATPNVNSATAQFQPSSTSEPEEAHFSILPISVVSESVQGESEFLHSQVLFNTLTSSESEERTLSILPIGTASTVPAVADILETAKVEDQPKSTQADFETESTASEAVKPLSTSETVKPSNVASAANQEMPSAEQEPKPFVSKIKANVSLATHENVSTVSVAAATATASAVAN